MSEGYCHEQKTKSVLSLILSICLVLILSVPASADTAGIQGMTDEIAGYIAEFFIVDNLTNPDISWTEDSVVSNIVEMYDPDGAVSAYSAEITTNGVDNGYIIISAYQDANSLITEYSDESAPLYEELDVSADDQIVYCGLMNYFKDEGDEELVTIDDETISKEVAEELAADSFAANSAPGISSRAKLGYHKPISDPIEYAIEVYGGSGSYTCYEYKNTLERYCEFGLQNNFQIESNNTWRKNCGPAAVANLIKIVGKHRKNAKIKTTSLFDIF